jgi:glycosyltransferase involved in cell wall biosynthesis
LLVAKRLLYPRADRVTAVAQGVKDDLVARLGLAPERISVVFNPVVDAELRQQAEEALDHPWFVAGSSPVLLAAGRLVTEKNFPLLLRAFARLRAERPLRLVILGEGPLRSSLQALARELGVAEDVDLPGFDPNPFRYMARAAAFVLSSRFEGLPGVLIQAMACGAAVIATDCPSGPAEIIEHGEDGFLVPVDGLEDLVQRLRQVLDDPELRHRLGARARQSVERFAVERVIGGYARALGR